MQKDNIPFYVINEPYELFYKNSSTSFPVGAHTHNKAEIYLTLTDLPDALLNNTVSSLPKGTLILIPPFCVHQLYHAVNVRYERYILNLDTDWLDNILPGRQELSGHLTQAAPPLILTLSEEQLYLLTEAMKMSLTTIQEKSLKSTSEFLSLLAILDSTVHNAHLSDNKPSMNISKSQKTVNEIIAYINEHIEEKITLSDIETHLYLNKDYLSRLFMKHTHTSIGRYISIQRISKAQEYLRQGFTVSQVSSMLGFSSYAYFFKTFQKMTGISPSLYRNH